MISPIKQYEILNQHLVDLIPKFKFSAAINLKLERIERLLALLDNPHRKYPTIHIGGTSGKGSTATMTAAILTAAGYKTGLHTSPHLQILNERHRIDGTIAPTSDLLRLLEEMLPLIEQVGQELPDFGKPSYFEVQFALSCCCFAEQKVDVAVVEVGLGGSLDSTNVLPARVAVVTSVGLDHTEILGDTLAEIAQNKAGIIKPNQTVITGATEPEAYDVIARRARRMENPLWTLGAEIDFEETSDDSVNFYVNGRTYFGIEMGMVGSFQVLNGALAVAAAQAFDAELSEHAVLEGLRNVRFAGRMEVVQTAPTVILDGAHNPDKMRAAAESLAYTSSRVIGIIGMKLGKDVRETLIYALPHLDEVIVTEFKLQGLWEAVSAETLAATVQELTPNLPVTIEPDVTAAIKHALAIANPADMIWLTGSLYLVGNARQYWYPNEQLITEAELPTAFTATVDNSQG